MDTKQIYAVYIGKGNYLQGVPARDMTREEWDAIDKATREMVVTLDLYRLNDRKSKAEEIKE